jgi:formylglycine-generating enzyme required for sulfatase activity
MLPLDAHELRLATDGVTTTPAGPLLDAALAHVRSGTGGLVILGDFGSGKTRLCEAICQAEPRASVVPLRLVARAATVEAGLERAVGRHRLQEAQRGDRILLLDGVDEVLDPIDGSHPSFFERLVSLAGPVWIATSRPSHFRTERHTDADQIDSLTRPGTRTLEISPLAPGLVRDLLRTLPRGDQLVATVEGLEDLARSPLLLHIIHAAVPFIEVGRPIQPWGVFDAWLRGALGTGPGHDTALAALEEMAWDVWWSQGCRLETTSFSPERVAGERLPPALRRALLVTDLDGQLRFGHRSVFEHLLATRIAPKLAENQGQGPDQLTGKEITEATRSFVFGRVAPMPVRVTAERTWIPRGNFISGGSVSPDERPLRIKHLASPAWIARAPVTHEQWLSWAPSRRQDANYLHHLPPDLSLPPGAALWPVFNIWPEDADRYADAKGARLPTADEWEKAARGVDGRRWPWSDWFRPSCGVTAELGLRNPLGVRAFGAHGDAALFSASGGVFEYTSTRWRDADDRGRVVMGGCFTHPAATSRCGLRLSHTLSGNLKAGLRLAWDATDG